MFCAYACYFCAQSCLTFWDSMDCSPPGSSVLGILQARILKWVAMPSYRESSLTQRRTCISCIGRLVLYPPSHLGSPMHILWHIHTLSLWYSRYLTMGCISLSCHISCSGGRVEKRHTTDSGLFMMAKNLKHLEYLKYHNSDTTLPDSKRALALDCAFNTCQYPTASVHLLTKILWKYLP